MTWSSRAQVSSDTVQHEEKEPAQSSSGVSARRSTMLGKKKETKK